MPPQGALRGVSPYRPARGGLSWLDGPNGPAQPLVKTLRSSEHERYGEQGQHARQKDQQDLCPPVHSSQPVHLVLIHAEEGAYEDVPLVVELTADAVPYGLMSGLCLLALFTVARRSREQVGPPRRSVATGTGVPRAP